MAKKRRNPNLSQAALERARAELYSAGGEVAVSPAPTTERKVEKPVYRVSKTTLTIDDLREEYGYVLVDLRNMALLAGFLFIALVVAALVFV